MREERRLKSFKNDHLSVSDQPGWTLILVGLFIAFTVGFSVRSLLAPSRIRPYIEQAAKQINKNMTVRLGPIEASLSRYGIPRFALILKNIRIHNHNECFKDTLLDITEIEIPIGFVSILRGQPEIKSVLLDEVELRIPEVSQNCMPLKVNPSDQKTNAKTAEMFSENPVSAAPFLNSVQAQAHPIPDSSTKELAKYEDSNINFLSIKKMRIIALEKPDVPLEFRNLNLEILQHRPQWVRLNASMGLFKDNKFSNYLTNSKVFVEYRAGKKNALTATVTGNIREGSYKIFAQYDPQDHFVNFEGDVKHFPLFEIYRLVPALQQRMTQISENSPIWLSARFNLSGDKPNILQNNMQLQQLRIEGDPLDFESEKIELSSLQPFKFQQFNVRLNKLNLDIINRILTRPVNNPSLYNLGQLEGVLVVRSPENMDFNGDWRNLGFIISNKGERRIQMLNRVAISGIFREAQFLKLKINKFEPQNGGLNGEAYLQHDLQEHKTNLAIEIDELNLDAEVIRLVTNGGYLQNLRGHFNIEWIKNKLSSLRGTLNSSEALVENLKMQKLKFEMRPLGKKTDEINAQIYFDKIEFKPAQFPLLMPLFSEIKETDLVFYNQQPKRQVVTMQYDNQNRSMNWNVRNLVNKEKNYAFISTGNWSTSGVLNGSVDIKAQNKTEQFRIYGTRSEPRIENKAKKN